MIASLIGVVVEEIRVQISPVPQAALLLGVFEVGQHGGRIAPASLAKKVAPDGYVLFGKFACVGEAPLQNLFIRAALKDALD